MIYLFDIDGTLTKPRQKITKEFAEYFVKWMDHKNVFLVTGSDLLKAREQLGDDVIKYCAGVFCSMANELYINGELIYRNEVKFPDTMIGWLEQHLESSQYPEKCGKHFEFRPGMLNFSVVGRNATLEQREKYNKWDLQNGDRKFISGFINSRYGDDYEACTGGQISIDIQPKGRNKSQASQWVRKNIGDRMHFFGDRCEKGGNDYDIVKDITEHKDGYWTQVFEPEHLKRVLETIE